jgi:dolichyl-phosphate-mannose--protein O-mannosyl transferase
LAVFLLWQKAWIKDEIMKWTGFIIFILIALVYIFRFMTRISFRAIDDEQFLSDVFRSSIEQFTCHYDADSVAATAGQIAGALYGCSGIPKEWKNKLVQYERIPSVP